MSPGTGTRTVIVSRPKRGERRRLRIGFAGASLLIVSLGLSLGLGACGSGSDGPSQSASAGRASAATDRDFDRGNFSRPTEIDNKWLPLSPGTQFVYEGKANRGHGRLRHRVVFTVTDLTKVINGVRNVVLWDRDYNAGVLQEGELTFHAQDDDGTVWNFGEYPEQYENGKFAGAPDSWIAGVAGARAGIIMRGDPRVGTPLYRQGWAPKIEFGDVARVFRTGQRNCIPLDCYENVVVTDETNPFEPNDGHQLKYNAPGVGTIRAAPGRGGKEREVLVLVAVKRLSPASRAEVRREALKLDQRAYRSRRDLYRHTPPAQHTSQGGQPS